VRCRRCPFHPTSRPAPCVCASPSSSNCAEYRGAPRLRRGASERGGLGGGRGPHPDQAPWGPF
jgi:hypothetical protein